MKLLYKHRQTGRTTELIQRCAKAEKNGEVSYIVCHTQNEAYRIAERAKQMNLIIGFPITFDEFLNHSYAGQNIDNFFIDNADMLLQRMAYGIKIHTISVTKE